MPQTVKQLRCFAPPPHIPRAEARGFTAGSVKSLDDHPARKLLERGLFITINTNDPKMFGNSLAEEYQLLEERLEFSRQELCTLILQGISASWMPADRKLQMTAAFCADPTWQQD